MKRLPALGLTALGLTVLGSTMPVAPPGETRMRTARLISRDDWTTWTRRATRCAGVGMRQAADEAG
jgi:hypothetical protein